MPIEEERQEILNLGVNPRGLQLSPESVRKFDVGNKFERRLSYLVGWDRNKFNLLQCTPDGVLKVVLSGGGLSNYHTLRDTIDGSTVTELKLENDDYYLRFDIIVYDNPVLVEFGVEPMQNYGGNIKLPPGYFSFDYTSKKIRVTLPEGGSATEVQIIAWF